MPEGESMPMVWRTCLPQRIYNNSAISNESELVFSTRPSTDAINMRDNNFLFSPRVLSLHQELGGDLEISWLNV